MNGYKCDKCGRKIMWTGRAPDLRYQCTEDPDPAAGDGQSLRKVEKSMQRKCYCIVIETGKNRFDRARERCRPPPDEYHSGGGEVSPAVCGCHDTVDNGALGICVTLLALTSRVGVSCVGAVMITFGIAGPVGDALMRENG